MSTKQLSIGYNRFRTAIADTSTSQASSVLMPPRGAIADNEKPSKPSSDKRTYFVWHSIGLSMLCKWRASGIACLTFAAILLHQVAFGQAPPILRNPFTTNSLTPATSQFDLTGNIFAITNTASITNASLYGTAITMPSLTPSRFLSLDGSGNVTDTGSSANLRASLSDFTGTGFAVFNTGPSFIGGNFSTTLTMSLATTGTVAVFNNLKRLVSLGSGTGSLTNDGSGNMGWAPGNSGTVTSVALTSPGVVYTVSGSPITTNGTLALSLVNQTSNTVFAGPTSGAAATPSFRAMVAADLPAVGTAGTYRSVTFDAQGRETSGSNPTTFAGYAISDTAANLGTALGTQTSNTVFAGPVSGSAATPTMRALVAADIPSLTGTYLPLAGGTMTGSITNALLPGPTLSGTTTNTSTFSGTFTNTGTMGISGASTLSGAITAGSTINASGTITAPGASIGTGGLLLSGSGSTAGMQSSGDTFFARESAAVHQFGQDATAQNTPVAQMIKGPDGLAGTGTNIAGANLTIAAGRNTGTGTGGSLLFQTAPAGSTGTAAGTLTTRLTIDSTGLATFANNETVGGTFGVTGVSTLSGAVTAPSLVITNGITNQLLTASTLVGTDANKALTSVTVGSGLTLSAGTLSASASGGASTWVPNATLAYSGGTNLTMSAAGGTNFTATITNTTFMAAPTEPPSTTGTNTSWTMTFKTDGTGGYSLTWSNIFKFPGGVAFVPTTNANAVSMVTITTSPYTAGQYYVDYGVLDLK